MYSSPMGLLAQKRIRAYSLIIIIVNSIMLGLTFARPNELTVFGVPFGGDFAAFYAAGRIVNEYGPGRLYDVDLEDALVHGVVAKSSAELSMPYVNPPFFGLLFAPLAKLPFVTAYLIWLALSVGLYVSAVLFSLRLNPSLPCGTTLLVALAFPPFCMYLLAGGQVSALGCLVLALTVHCARTGHPFDGGLVLALLLYKPPLLLLVLPMILITKQWRLFAGFVAGTVILASLSFLLVGLSGLARYAAMLRVFYEANNATEEVFQTWKYVDVGAAMRLITGHSASVIRFMLLAAFLPLLLLAWRKVGAEPLSWALAIVCTLLLNFYTPIYDCTLLVFPVIWLGPEKIGGPLLAVLFAVSLVSVPLAQVTHVQLFTVALAWLAWRLYILTKETIASGSGLERI
jgi:hypothetical protein